MKHINRNIRVIAENNEGNLGFNIYLDFSGQREFLMFHRHNGLLFSLLKDGVCVADLTRWTPWKGNGGYMYIAKGHQRHVKKLVNMVSHLLDVIEAYMEERMAVQKITPEGLYLTPWRKTAA